MPRYTAAHMWSNASAANYKASLQAVSDALKSVLTQTADTGQVVWANVTTLPATNAVRDYEVYRFSDALQATKPIFIRVDYMSQGSVRARFTVGTTTDGAGNLGGVLSPLRLDGHDYTNSTFGTATSTTDSSHGGITSPTGAQLYASSDGSYLTLIAAHQPTVTGAVADQKMVGFTVERTRNSDGTANGEGYSTSFVAQNAHQGMTYRYTNGNAQPLSDRVYHLLTLLPDPGQSQTYVGDTAYAFPVHGHSPLVQGAAQNQLLVIRADFPRMTEVTVPHYGQNATWLPLGPMGSVLVYFTGTANTAVANNGYGLMWRY